MKYSLPYSVVIDGKEYAIRNKCDFRVVLDVIEALNDDDLTDQEKAQCALYIFYGDDCNQITNYEEAIEQMMLVINGGEKNDPNEPEKPKLMDWEHDFTLLAPPISRTLGYDVRTPDKYTHWWTFLAGYMEIGECTFSSVVAIRSKKAKGKKLDKSEEEFYRNNRKMIDLPKKLTSEEEEWLNSDW